MKKARLHFLGKTTNCAREFFLQTIEDGGENLDRARKILGLTSSNALRRYTEEIEPSDDLPINFHQHPVDQINLNTRDY